MFGVYMEALSQCRAEIPQEDLICQSPYHKIVFCISVKLSEKKYSRSYSSTVISKFIVVLFWSSSLSVLKFLSAKGGHPSKGPSPFRTVTHAMIILKNGALKINAHNSKTILCILVLLIA